MSWKIRHGTGIELFLVSLFILVAFAVYLNIGWALATYFDKHVATVSAENLETFWQKALAGGWGYLAGGHVGRGSVGLVPKVLFMLFWPVLLALAFVGWLVWVIWYLLWLIFAGGIAKLLGLG